MDSQVTAEVRDTSEIHVGVRLMRRRQRRRQSGGKDGVIRLGEARSGGEDRCSDGDGDSRKGNDRRLGNEGEQEVKTEQ